MSKAIPWRKDNTKKLTINWPDSRRKKICFSPLLWWLKTSVSQSKNKSCECKYVGLCLLILFSNPISYARCTMRPSKPKHQRSLDQRKVHCRVMQGEGWLLTQKNCELLKRCQQSTFKGKVREANCWKLFGIGIFYCSYPPRSGEDVPVNLHQDKCCCLFCKFLSIYEWTLRGRSLENKLFCIFQATGYRTWSLK